MTTGEAMLSPLGSKKGEGKVNVGCGQMEGLKLMFFFLAMAMEWQWNGNGRAMEEQ